MTTKSHQKLSRAYKKGIFYYKRVLCIDYGVWVLCELRFSMVGAAGGFNKIDQYDLSVIFTNIADLNKRFK